MNYRKAAKGQDCMVRLPGCNGGGRTTILAHYRLSPYTGIGMKPDDYVFGAWCCSECHDLVDGRKPYEGDRMAVRLAHAEGILRTQMALKSIIPD